MQRKIRSESGRTVIDVELDELGAGRILVTVDGITVSHVGLSKEQGTRYLTPEEKEAELEALAAARRDEGVA